MSGALAGRVAIITGANQGMGFEIAKKYVVAGAALALCARDDRRLASARAELAQLASSGQRIVVQACDVSKPHDVRVLVETTVRTLGRIDILVNNAGVYGPKGATADVDWNEWVRAIEINVFG